MKHYKIQSTSLRGTPKQPHHHNRFASGYLAMTLALVFFSCDLKQEEQKPSLLSDFWKQEITRLNKEKPMITKISTVNGKTDTIVTDSIDWEKELQVFVKNDIYEKDLNNYEVDKDTMVKSDKEPMIIQKLKAKNDKEKIQYYKVQSEFDNHLYLGDSLLIIVNKNQELYNSYKKLKYTVGVGYEIIGSQDVKFLNGINYKVQVKFKE